MRARLLPLDSGPAIDLVKDLTLVGRNDDCDVRLDHKSVSKLHCILVKTDGLVLVRDLGSTNGTRVNGQRVRRAALLPNDQLAIATFRYKVRFGDGPDEPESNGTAAPTGDVAAATDSDEHPSTSTETDKDKPVIGPPLRRNVLPDVYTDTAPNS
jgi:pSer/pThr/pTyr-binding forkhead associated (FHA) protein